MRLRLVVLRPDTVEHHVRVVRCQIHKVSEHHHGPASRFSHHRVCSNHLVQIVDCSLLVIVIHYHDWLLVLTCLVHLSFVVQAGHENDVLAFLRDLRHQRTSLLVGKLRGVDTSTFGVSDARGQKWFIISDRPKKRHGTRQKRS